MALIRPEISPVAHERLSRVLRASQCIATRDLGQAATQDHTRFISLKSKTQLIAWTGSSVLVGWGIVATAILLMDSIGAGNFRAQAERDKMIYGNRLISLSEERDLRAEEAIAAQERFAAAHDQVSAMQSELLASEERTLELETGLEVVHDTLR